MYKIKRFAKAAESSERDKDLKKKARKANAAAVGLTVLGSLGTGAISSSQLNKMAEKGDMIDPTEATNLTKKIRGKAKDMGVKVVEDPNFNNSAYAGSPQGKKLRNTIAYLKKKGKNSKLAEGSAEILESFGKAAAGGSEELYKHLGKDAIVMGNVNGPAVMAHELGHASHYKGRARKTLGGLLGTGAHKAYGYQGATGIGSQIYAWNQGKKAARAEAEGKKTSTWNKVGSAVVPLALSAPVLVSEAAASRRGLQLLKEAGASKEALKASKGQLGHAFNTYLARSASQSVGGLATRQLGKAHELRKIRKKEEKNKEDKNNV